MWCSDYVKLWWWQWYELPDRSLDEGDDEALDGVCDGAGQFPKDPVEGAKACQVLKSKACQVLSVKC